MSKKPAKKQFFLWQLSGLALVLAVAALYFRTVAAGSDIRRIVLITIDTCRADYLGCYGCIRPTTPNIDKLSEQAVLFENVVSPIPITLPYCRIYSKEPLG